MLRRRPTGIAPVSNGHGGNPAARGFARAAGDQTILIKRNLSALSTPQANSLLEGELAVQMHNGTLYCGVPTTVAANGLRVLNPGGGVTISESAPVSPSVADLWFDAIGGQLYIYYDDGTNQQWVVVVNQGGGAAFDPDTVELDGGTW